MAECAINKLDVVENKIEFLFNKEKYGEYDKWLNREVSLDILNDRIRVTPRSQHVCEVQFATKEVDLSHYRILRIYGNTGKVEDGQGGVYDVRFGVYQSGLNLSGSFQMNKWVASAFATNINGFRDLDIRQVIGKYKVGFNGKLRGDIFKMELIR